MDENEIEEALEELEAEGLIETVPTVELNVSMDVKIDASVQFPDDSKLVATGLKSGIKIAYSARKKRNGYPWGYTIEERSALTIPYEKVEDVLKLLHRIVEAQAEAAQQQQALTTKEKS